MKKIMPNDRCPCMSGKKYKHCCSRNKELLDFIKQNTGGDYIDSSYVLNDVISHSSQMETYLKEILPKIDMNIMFSVNTRLNANMRSGGILDANIGIIIVKKVPIHEKDYFDLAHEFGHLLLYKKGYPGFECKDKNLSGLDSVVGNTIMDPMINKMLYKYGFDFIEYLKKGFAIQIPIFRNYPEEDKLDIFNRHFLKCLIIEKELEWEIIDESLLENKFKLLYQVKYPTLYQEAIDFIDYVKKMGIEPEHVRKAFEKLLKDNDMENFISIVG